MSIELNSGLKINAPVVLDDRMVMTKEQMLDANDTLKNKIPDGFLVQCKDDGQIYVYHKNGEADLKTGKFEQYVNKELADMALNGIRLKKIEDYLYEITASDIDYEWARKVFEEGPPVGSYFGGCSSMRRANFHGRNFDWKYDNAVEFVVKTEAAGNRHASVGTACNIKGLNKDFVASRAWSANYKAVPFLVVDGVNDAGVCCNINIVPARKWNTIDPATGNELECDGLITNTVPTVSKSDRICSIMLPRFILDNFTSAYAAAVYIQEHVEVFTCDFLTNINEEVHIMISDMKQSYIVEFLTITDNTLGTDPVCTTKIIPVYDSNLHTFTANAPVMTNFHIFGVNAMDDASKLAPLFTPYTQDSDHDAIKTNRIEPYGAGIERYNILLDESVTEENTYNAMLASMKKVWYTHTYTETEPVHEWYSEMATLDEAHSIDIKVNTPYTDIEPYMEIGRQEYAKRTRADGATWQTVHTAVFDMKYKIMYIVCQENPDFDGAVYQYNFGLSPMEIPVEIETPTTWSDVYVASESSFTLAFSDNGMASFNGAFTISNVSTHYSKTDPFEYELILTTKELSHNKYYIPNAEVPAYFSIIGDDEKAPSILYPIMCKVSSSIDGENKCVKLTVKLPTDDETAKVKVIFNHTFMMAEY